MSKIILQITYNNRITTLRTISEEQRQSITTILGKEEEHEKVVDLGESLVKPEIFVDAVCKYFRVKKELLSLQATTRDYVFARSIIYYYFDKHLKYEREYIASLFKCTPSAVYNSVKSRAPKLMKQYEEIMAKILSDTSS